MADSSKKTSNQIKLNCKQLRVRGNAVLLVEISRAKYFALFPSKAIDYFLKSGKYAAGELGVMIK